MNQTSPLTTEQVEALLAEWPFPLPALLRGYWLARLDGDGSPTRPPAIGPFLDLSGTLTRFLGIVLVAEYLRVEEARPDSALNRALIDKLGSPSDGAWRELAQNAARALAGTKDRPAADVLIPELVSFAPITPRLPPVECLPPVLGNLPDPPGGLTRWQLGDYLVRFRNACYYRSQEARTDENLLRAATLLEWLIRDLACLTRYRLAVRTKNTAQAFNGLLPRTWEPPAGSTLVDKHPALVATDGRSLDLWPFVVPIEAPPGAEADQDELLYYSRASAQGIEFQAYRRPGSHLSSALGHVGKVAHDDYLRHLRRLAVRAAPESLPEPRFEDAPLLERHRRFFVGRQGELEAVVRWLFATSTGFGSVVGTAGSGKSALMCRLRDFVAERQAQPNSPLAPFRFVWHHFLRQEGRDRQVLVLRSLCQQTADALGRVAPSGRGKLPETLADLRARLASILNEVGDHNKTAQQPVRLVFVLDGLDEAVPYPGAEDELLKSFPDTLPDGVVVLVSYRIGADGRPAVNLGAKRNLVKPCLPRPLGKLAADALQELLTAKVGAEVERRVVEVVWERSEGEPLYFVLLADALTRGDLAVRDLSAAPVGFESFVRQRVWVDLPASDDCAAHRLLALLSVLRGPCTDALARSALGLSATAVSEARARLGTFLNVTGDESDPGYSLYHDRVRQAIHSLFTPDEIADYHAAVIAHFEGSLRSGPALTPDVRRGLADLTYHRFERGRLRADFAELFAVNDAGFLDQKLARLQSPADLNLDYDLLLRACMMADDLPRAARLALERSTLASEAGWLATPGMAGLLTRVAPLIGPSALDSFLGMIELIPDDLKRTRATLDAAAGTLDHSRASRLIEAALRTLSEKPADTPWAKYMGQAVGLIAARFPEHRERAAELIRRHRGPDPAPAAPGAGGLAALFGSLLGVQSQPKQGEQSIAQEELAEGLAPWLVHSTGTGDLLSGFLELLHSPTHANLGLSQDFTPNRLGVLLESRLWQPVRAEDRPLVEAVSDFLAKHGTRSAEAYLLVARFRAWEGNWDAASEAIGQTLGTGTGEHYAAQFARIGMVLCELDRPGAPMAHLQLAFTSADDTAAGGYDAGLRLLNETRQFRSDKANIDLRGKREGIPVRMKGMEIYVGGLGELCACQAAASARLGNEESARKYFHAGTQVLSRSSLNDWSRDLPALVRAALAFPTDAQRAARLFEVLAALDAAGLNESSENTLAPLLEPLLPEIGYVLAEEFERPVLRRLADLARSLRSEDARVRILIAVARRLWDASALEESLRLTREVCLALAFADRLKSGPSGYRAAHTLCEQDAARLKMLTVLCTLAEADPDHESAEPLLDTIGELLAECPSSDEVLSALARTESLVHRARVHKLSAGFFGHFTRAVACLRDAGAADQFLHRALDRFGPLGDDIPAAALAAIARVAADLKLPARVNGARALALAVPSPDHRSRICGELVRAFSELPGEMVPPGGVEELLAAVVPDTDHLRGSQQQRMSEAAAQLGYSDADLKSWANMDKPQGDSNDTLRRAIHEYMGDFGSLPQRLVEDSHTKGRIQAARHRLRLGRLEEAVRLLDQPVRRVVESDRGGTSVASTAGELIDLALEAHERSPDLARELAELVDATLVEESSSDWIGHGLKLARLFAQLGQPNRARALVRERIDFARDCPEFPGLGGRDLIRDLVALGDEFRPEVREALGVMGAWKPEAMGKVGTAALVAIEEDIESAFRIAGLMADSDSSEDSGKLTELAQALKNCPPRWAVFAAHRLVSLASRKPRDATLCVLAVMTQSLRGVLTADAIGTLKSLVLGPGGYDLLDNHE